MISRLSSLRFPITFREPNDLTYCTYVPHGNTAHFANLRLNSYLDSTPLVIILEEAHRTDDLLLLNWHYSDSPVSYTSRLIRKGHVG